MAQTVLITGANRGIGLALSQGYAAAGAAVLATCPDMSQAEDLHLLAAENPSVEIFPLDVSDDASIKALAQNLKGRTLDILINNAGIISGSPEGITGMALDESQILGTIDPVAWDKVLRTNTIGPIMVTQALLPCFEKSTTRKVAMISSRMGSMNDNIDPDFIAYSSSKTALNAAMRNIALRLQKDGFMVVSLNPGWVRTRMGGEQANLAPEESAARVIKVIENLKPEQNGLFVNHTGETIAW